MSLRGWIGTVTGGWRRLNRLHDLHQAVTAHLAILPVAGAQLRDASRQVEQAVSRVSGNFERMVECAKAGANQASELMGATGSGSGSSGGVQAMLVTSRKTFEDLLVDIVQDGQVCTRLVNRLDSLESDMHSIVRTLADVDRISFGNTILALNARIEAVHVGERGQGFELIAQELWTQARRSEEITGGIRETIKHLAGEAKAAMAEVSKMACADHQRIAALEQEVTNALNGLEGAHSEMQNSLSSTGGRNATLQGEIAQAIETLQFEDRVNQRIGHIVDALESMHADIAGSLDGNGAGGSSHASVAAGLASTYTMEAERAVHAAILGEAQAAEQLSDVEIF